MRTNIYKPEQQTIYDLLNDVQTDISQYDNEPVTELDMQRLKQQAKRITGTSCRKQRVHQAAGVACALMLAVGLVAVSPADSPVYAAKESAAYQISQLLGMERNLDVYTETIGTVQSDNGYTIQLNEVILDRNTLLVGTEVYVENGEALPMAIPSGDVYINGRDAARVSTGSAGSGDGAVQGALIQYHLADGIDTSGELDIKLVYHNISLKEGSPSGKWVFHFTADGSALAADTRVIPLDYSLTLENGAEIRLTDYTGNVIAQRIDYSMHGQVNRDVKLEGVDDRGQKIVFLSNVYEGNLTGTKGHGYLQCDSVTGTAITEDTKWLELQLYLGQDDVDEDGRSRTNFETAGEPLRIILTE